MSIACNGNMNSNMKSNRISSVLSLYITIFQFNLTIADAYLMTRAAVSFRNGGAPEPKNRFNCLENFQMVGVQLV